MPTSCARRGVQGQIGAPAPFCGPCGRFLCAVGRARLCFSEASAKPMTMGEAPSFVLTPLAGSLSGRSPLLVCAQVNSRRELRSEPFLGPLGPLELFFSLAPCAKIYPQPMRLNKRLKIRLDEVEDFQKTQQRQWFESKKPKVAGTHRTTPRNR